MCIGSGVEEICEDFDVTIFASDTASDIPHIRTVPTQGLVWDIETNYDGSTKSWDMSSAGMLKVGWIWSASGDLSINGTMLEMSGQNGQLHLDLPFDAPPMRHFFNQTESNSVNADLSISLHVLQVFRAAAEVVSPDDGSVLNVSERTKLILRLENPGNGEDTFQLSGSTLAGNLSQAPNATFEITNPTRTLGPGGISMVPVWVTLPDDIPARETFQLVFDWDSIGNSNVGVQTNITVEVRPDHRWDIIVQEGLSHQVTPGQVLDLTIDLTNTGNSDDLLTLSPQFDITRQGNDNSSWSAEQINSSRLEIMENETVMFELNIPTNTWAGTIANLTLATSSEGYVIEYDVMIQIEVLQVAGWKIDLSDTSLEISPEGGEIQLTVEQIGNAPAEPYFVKAGDGWNVSLPTSGPTVEPGNTGSFNITVYPPDDSIAGEVGVVSIQISNGDGSGKVVEQVPVRIGSVPGIIVDSKGSWKVREGVSSWPTAWIENTGNDVAIMELNLNNLPSGWTLSGDEVIVVAPSEIKGVPLQITPASSWNGVNIQLEIELIHPILGTITHSITVNESDTVLVSSPVHTGRTGEKVTITTNSETNGILSSLVPLPDSRSNTTHNGMPLHLVGIPAPVHSADCENAFGNLDLLGIESISKTWTSCTLSANLDHDLVANAWLKTSRGEILDSRTIRLSANESNTVNLSTSNWDPEPGIVSVEILIIDSNGLQLYSETTTHVARQSGWNVRVSSLVVNDNFVEVGIDRSGYQMMEGSVCQLKIEVTDGDWEKNIAIDVFGSVYAPGVSIDRPSEIGDGAEVSATISCLAPWDVDDNPDDDSMTVYASNLPVVTYGSSDVYWTIGIALIMLLVAFFAGVLNFQRNETEQVENKSPDSKQQPKPVVENKDEVQLVQDQISNDDMSLDDMSFDEPAEGVEPTAVQNMDQENDLVVEPKEEVIDIDDSTASGRLSALRKEMATDSGEKDNSRDDLSKRLDSFLKDR